MKQQDLPTAADTAESAVPFWRDAGKRAIGVQIIALFIVAGVSYYLFSNTQANLERQSIATGFGFLGNEAAFEIGESLIRYTAADSYAKALLVGALNTLKVAFIGIILTTILGTLVGIARLSKNWLLSKIAGAFIEVMQNIPILLQLFFWYAIFYETFPSPRQALNPVKGIFLCNRGFIFAIPETHSAHATMGWMFLAVLVGGWFLNRWGYRRQELTGQAFPTARITAALALFLPLLIWALYGAPTAMNTPELRGFNFQGGLTVSPEFAALLLGLVLYTS
ncbi:MAG: ABC transporter permease subunit, partial [Desulfuromonadales bacterium]|nr:ABC transporter permease subunit [Desulfuromonadales bacterium]